MRVKAGVFLPQISPTTNKNYVKKQTSFDSVAFSGFEQSKRIPQMYKTFYKFKNCGGEMESIVLNGVGKTLIAPAVLIFNPISKGDKDARFYSAWKQPIEGIVSVALQLGLLLKSAKFVDKLALSGKLKKYDLSQNSVKNTGKELIKQRYRELNVFKARLGLGLTLLTTPVICSVVNYIFPKFMKQFFPNLCTDSKKGILA